MACSGLTRRRLASVPLAGRPAGSRHAAVDLVLARGGLEGQAQTPHGTVGNAEATLAGVGVHLLNHHWPAIAPEADRTHCWRWNSKRAVLLSIVILLLLLSFSGYCATQTAAAQPPRLQPWCARCCRRRRAQRRGTIKHANAGPGASLLAVSAGPAPAPSRGIRPRSGPAALAPSPTPSLAPDRRV